LPWQGRGDARTATLETPLLGTSFFAELNPALLTSEISQLEFFTKHGKLINFILCAGDNPASNKGQIMRELAQ
jgi:hypothetical protein